jgi:hypothetical protein
VTLKVYQELSGPEQVAGTFTLTNHLNFPFTYSADVLSLGSSFEGRYLRLAISSAYLFAPSDTFAYAIIGEVVVSARTPSSPNPTAIALDPNGDVRVTFSGTLESSTVLNGAFDDVPGSPAGTYVIPKGELVSEQYFRVKGEFTGETP